MKHLFLIICFLPLKSYAQQIVGFVLDASSGESLVAAHIAYKKEVLLTNEYGYFSLVVSNVSESDSITISYLGYETLIVKADTLKYLKNNPEYFYLRPNNIIDEIEITAKIFQNNIHQISKYELDNIPLIIGEADLLKSLTLLPGITTGKEASSNLYIRGGTPDQNLILIDNIPVYNASHLGGYLSNINAQSVKSAEIFKGYSPARFGGRNSSVINLTLKEGNNERLNWEYNLGTLTSSFLLEGPLQKSQSSFFLAGRSSYLGLANLFRNKNGNFLDYWLYDVTAKVNYPLKKGYLFGSLYLGNDYGTNQSIDKTIINGVSKVQNKSVNTIAWGNKVGSIRYILPLKNNIFFKSMAGFSQYHYSNKTLEVEQNILNEDNIPLEVEYTNSTKINDFFINFEVDYQYNNALFFKSGLGYINHSFDVGATTNISNDIISYHPNEFFFFSEGEFNIGNLNKTNIGLRVPFYEIDDNVAILVEPRINSAFALMKNATLNLYYSRNNQYLHLISSNGFSFPNDLWFPATKNTPIQSAHITGLDFVYDIKNIQLSSAVYYKLYTNLIEFAEGSINIFENLLDWENHVTKHGTGQSVGWENYIAYQDRNNKFTIAYTLSKHNRQFNDLNFGNSYSFNFDRRHDISIYYSRSFKNHFSGFLNFIFQSGSPVTLPIGAIEVRNSESLILLYGDRNNARLPNYNRLDLGMKYNIQLKNDKKLGLQFSIYNVYNRLNTTYFYFASKPIIDSTGKYLRTEYEFKNVGLFPILPSFTIKYSL